MSETRFQPPSNVLTIRTTLMNAIFAACEAEPFVLGDTDPQGAKLFDVVKFGGLDDLAPSDTPGVAIEEGTENIVALAGTNYGTTQKTLRVLFNIKVVRSVGVDPMPVINYYFGRIVQLFVNTPHLASLALCVDEAGNSIETNGSNDPEPGGTIYLDIDYRHVLGDPFTE